MLIVDFKGVYPSSMHRVTAPGGLELANGSDQDIPERNSLIYFLVPDPDAILYTPASRIIADKVMRYEPVVFRTHSEKLFKASQKGREIE